MIKYKSEWGLINETAKANRLSVEETILLFAMREVEAGSKGNEFNKPNVQNSNLAVQADSMANQIAKGQFLYTKYIKGQSPIKLEDNEAPMPFVEFLGQHLMSNEGCRKDNQWIKDIQSSIEKITKELETKDGNAKNN